MDNFGQISALSLSGTSEQSLASQPGGALSWHTLFTQTTIAGNDQPIRKRGHESLLTIWATVNPVGTNDEAERLIFSYLRNRNDVLNRSMLLNAS